MSSEQAALLVSCKNRRCLPKISVNRVMEIEPNPQNVSTSLALTISRAMDSMLSRLAIACERIIL